MEIRQSLEQSRTYGIRGGGLKEIIITFIICATIYSIVAATLEYRAEVKRLEKIQELEDVKNWKYGGT